MGSEQTYKILLTRLAKQIVDIDDTATVRQGHAWIVRFAKCQPHEFETRNRLLETMIVQLQTNRRLSGYLANRKNVDKPLATAGIVELEHLVDYATRKNREVELELIRPDYGSTTTEVVEAPRQRTKRRRKADRSGFEDFLEAVLPAFLNKLNFASLDNLLAAIESTKALEIPENVQPKHRERFQVFERMFKTQLSVIVASNQHLKTTHKDAETQTERADNPVVLRQRFVRTMNAVKSHYEGELTGLEMRHALELNVVHIAEAAKRCEAILKDSPGYHERLSLNGN
jgi:hypothetical protein